MKNINKHANRDFINNEAVIIVKCRNKCNNFLNFKFEFPGKNLNQSEKGIYGEYYITIAKQLFLRNRNKTYNRFLGLHPKINLSKRQFS